MNRFKMILWLGLSALLLAGCATRSEGAAQAGPAVQPPSALDTSYENALPVRNQLALGTLRLEETDEPITDEQAAALLPLWQALRGTLGSGASAQAEIDALLQQIEGTLSASQLAAITGMELTQSDLQAWAQSQGLSSGSGAGTGAGGGLPGGGLPGGGLPGSGQSLSPEERATRQAEREGGGAGGTSRALIEAVIELVESK
jgi:hypothetical protein